MRRLLPLALLVLLAWPAAAQNRTGNAVGTVNIATSQVSVANTSTATAAARNGRHAVTITVTGSSAQDVYCGPGTITTATGDIIPGVKGAARTYNTQAAINCIVGSSTQTVTVSETY